jgi:HK97 family phage portal protein
MNIFQRLRKKEAPVLLTNEDWKILSSILFKYVNRDQNINTIVNKNDYITKAYLYNATIFSIISLRANAAKGVPWIVYKIKNTQKFREYRNITRKDLDLHKTLVLKEQSLEEVENGSIVNLIKNPNPWMTFADLIEGMFVYRDVTGDAYMYHIDNNSTSEILQLHLLPADRTKIVGGTFLDPIGGYRCDYIFDKIIDKEKVLHWKYFNPLWDADGRQLYGISPLVSAVRMINADNEAVNNEAASFANEGVKGILTGTENTEIEFTKEQADLLVKKLKKATERAKAGEGNIAFNRAPMNYLKIGETPVDLGVIDSKKYNKEIFCNLFRIHPALLSSDASTLNNLKEARKSLMTLSVMPDMDGFRENFNVMIQKAFGEEWFVDYDIMAISELQDDIEKIAKTYQLMDWVTTNEKRAATNYDAYKDVNADILMTDMGKVPLGYGMDSGFEKIDEEIQKRR